MAINRSLAFAGLLAILATSRLAVAAPFPPLNITTADPLEKIFRDTPAPLTTGSLMEAARGEHASFQVVITSCPVDLKNVRCEITSFTAASSASLDPTPPRFVGYIGSSISATRTTPTQQLRPAPAMYPDPLLEIPQQDILAGHSQPVWITVPIPTTAPTGDYSATATVAARMFGEETSASIPLHLRVYPATVSKTRLNVDLWYQMDQHADWPMREKFSDAWFDVLRGYVKSMTAHRINWGWIETHNAVTYSRDSNGRLNTDFTNFDKWMEVLLSGGMTNIEGQHFAFRIKSWTGPFGVRIFEEKDGKWQPEKVPLDDPRALSFFAEYLPQLQAHLEARGWLDIYRQHVGDEPLDANADSYTTAAALLKKYAPKLKIMEAVQTEKAAGIIHTWIPQLDHFAKDYDFLMKRKAAGDEIWFYTCMYPQGDYANRFLEQPLIQTRLLHWMNYRYGATGYLHWGWNWYTPHPWDNAADFRMMQLPGGDAQVVYPQPGGPGVWDSIRYEAMRDGIEDHELLSQLGEKSPDTAMDLAKRLVRGFTDYNQDIAHFRQLRRELLQALSQ